MRRKLELNSDQINLLYASDKLHLDSGELFEKFVESKRLIGVKETTVKHYYNLKRVIDRDTEVLEIPRKLAELEEEDVQQLILYWQRLGLVPASINSKLRVMKTFFRFMADRGFRKTYVMQNIKNVREKVEIKDTLEKPEIKLISQWFKMQKSFAGFRNLVLFQFLLDTGVRISEALSIKLQDIREDTVYILEAKGLKQRIVFLSKQMRETLDIYLDIRGSVDTDYLFVNIDGNQLQKRTFQEDMRDAVQACGIEKKITPHALRRTYARYAVMAGIDPFSLATLLGHSSLEVTTRYVQMWGQDLKRQSEKRGNFSGLF